MKCKACGKPCCCSRECSEYIKREQAQMQSDAHDFEYGGYDGIRRTAEPSDPYPEGRLVIYHPLDSP